MDQHRINALLNLLSCFDRTEMSLSKGRRTRARVRERISASPIVLTFYRALKAAPNWRFQSMSYACPFMAFSPDPRPNGLFFRY